MPTRPLRPLTLAGGTLDGPLNLPGATAVAVLDLSRPHLVVEPATVETAHVAVPDAWCGGATCIELVRAGRPGDEHVLADLWLTDGRPSASVRLAPGAGDLSPGDLLHLRRREAPVRGGLVPSLLHSIVASVELRQVL